MKHIEVVAAALIQDHKVLITQRDKGEFSGLWEFPGGKIEPFETHHQALIREIHEELNINVEPTHLLKTIQYQYPNFHLTMHLYACTLADSKQPLLIEHRDMRWVKSNELDDIPWLPADIDAIAPLKNQLETK